MSIRCGHCKQSHPTIADVRQCSVRHYTPSDGANATAATLKRALAEADILAEEGVYRWHGRVFRVVTRDGRRIAEEYVSGAYCYAKGMVYRLKPANRMTLDECKAWGRQEVRCIRCGTRLEKETSREAGIGPVCATKV